MELWIRSQDRKTLMKITRLYEFSNSIFSIDSRENEIILGTYKKEKRALEILDEIEELDTDKKNIIVSGYFGNLIKITYEMPEE